MLKRSRSILFMSAPALTLLCLSLSSFICLASTTVSAEETFLDHVDISVPVSCNLNSSVDTAHTAIVNAGTSVSDIGTTNFTVFCNDASGFALYAIGYTNEDEGDNTLVGQTTSNIINTGQATSGDTSAWAMKMVKVTDGSYQPNNLTITNNFNNYKEVPDTYTKVAQYTSSTDFTLGSKLQSTYRAFISTFQDTDTYNGKVKYTLVHPYYTDTEALRNAITVVYDGNGLTFPNGQTTNTVKYSRICTPAGYDYVANTPYDAVGTSNLNSDGTPKQNSPSYTDSESILQTITVPNADKVKVVVDYGITAGTLGVMFVEGAWNADSDPEVYHQFYSDEQNMQGQRSFVFNGDTVTIYAESWNTPESGYDYGFYAKVYAVYDTEQPNTTGEELPSNDCSVVPISGTYMETEPWHDKWTATIDGSEKEFTKEYCEGDICDNLPANARESVKQFIRSYYDTLTGTTLTLYAYNPVTFDMVYAAANKTKIGDYYAIQDLDSSMCQDVTMGEKTTVIDIRDNSVYSIGRLEDGNCWLRDNLKLDPTDATTAANMSASNTNASNDAIYNYLHGGNPGNIAGWTSATVKNAAVGETTSHSSYTEPFVHNGRKNNYNGTYFNYCAASVGTFCYNYNNSPSSGSSEQDLCPNEWRIPRRSEYSNLRTAIGGNMMRFSRISGLSYGGDFSFSSNTYGNDEGKFWSSDILDRTTMWAFRFSGVTFTSGNPYGIRYEGYSVRCVLPVST